MLIKNMMEDLGSTEEAIPIPNVSLPSTLMSPSFLFGSKIVNPGQRICSQEGHWVVWASQEWSSSHGWWWLRLPQENNRHWGVGSKVHAGRPGNAIRNHLGKVISSNPKFAMLMFNLGLELPRHQAPPRRRLQDRRQHDQGQVPRRNPKDIQHHQWFYSRRGRPNPPWEWVGWGPLNALTHITQQRGVVHACVILPLASPSWYACSHIEKRTTAYIGVHVR